MSLNLELHTLRMFAAVAEEEHVGRASARLHISQSPLSRQVRKLERDLGLELFVRRKKRLHLTPTGRWFLGEARSLLAHAERLQNEAVAAASGRRHLVIGFVRSAVWSGVLPRALRELRVAAPDIEVQLRAMTTAAQFAALARGEIGLALVHAFAQQPGLVATRVLDEPDVLAIPRDHPLAKRAAIRPRDLDGQSWIALSIARDRFVAACAGAGFTPNIAYEVTDTATVLGLVEAGMGISILPASAVKASTDVVARAVSWLPFATRVWAVLPAEGASTQARQLAALFSAGASR